jgi:hypothetical protein
MHFSLQIKVLMPTMGVTIFMAFIFFVTPAVLALLV